MAALSHRELRRFYLYANKKWFEGKLPREMDVLFAPTDGCHAIIEQDEAGNEAITVDPKYSICTVLWKQHVLHEMAHRSSGDWKHGRKFYAEIDRLYAAGAFRGLL